MFDIGWTELVVIGVVALIAIGPKELPGVLRACGQWMGKIRRMAADFQDQFRDAMREAEVADLKKTVDDMTATASSYTNFDPMETIRRDTEAAMGSEPVDTPPPAATAEAAAPSTVATSDPGAIEPAPTAADATVATASPAPQPKTGEGA